MKWQLSRANQIWGFGLGGPMPDIVLDEVRPGDSLCVVINSSIKMWCKVIFRTIDESSFVCFTSYPIKELGISSKQKIIVRGYQVINILAGGGNRKSWNRFNEAG